MLLRFHIPELLFVISPTPESCEGQTTFTYKQLQCSLEVVLEAGAWDNPRGAGFVGMVRELKFTVRQEPRGNTIQSLIDTRAYRRLVTIMRTIANRCLRAIRNVGKVPSVHELPPVVEDYEAEVLLEILHAEVSVDGLNWTQIIQRIDVVESRRLFSLLVMPRIIYENLDMHRWAEIEKVIQDDLPPLPELEFTVNAIEHLHLRNFRLALVESVIGLEIVLSRYLRIYLRTQKKVPEARIDDFLTPDLTLYTRLSGLLDFTLPPDVFQQINLGDIRKAVRWRHRRSARSSDAARCGHGSPPAAGADTRPPTQSHPRSPRARARRSLLPHWIRQPCCAPSSGTPLMPSARGPTMASQADVPCSVALGPRFGPSHQHSTMPDESV
jgi:hypothetical protein